MQKFAKKVDFKGIKFPGKIRDIPKIEKKNSTSIIVFGYKNREKHLIYISKKYYEKKHVDLLLIREEGKKRCVFIKYFNTSMYDNTLHHKRKQFCLYCLKAFSTEEILKSHIKDSLKINGKQRIIMPKKGEFVKFKNYERKIKSLFIIYADFEIFVMPENNGKKNPKESYTSKYQKHIACSYGFKLVCVNDKVSKPFKRYLGENAV